MSHAAMFTLEDFLQPVIEDSPLAKFLQRTPRPNQLREIVIASAVESVPPFFTGWLAGRLAKRQKSRLWVVCRNSRHQEEFYQQLLCWWPQALWVPDLEVSVAEGATPDPDNQAERLETIERLGGAPDFHVIVVHESSWEQKVPSYKKLSREVVVLRRGMIFPRDEFLPRFQKHGYTVVPQVTERGQIAVRGGIVDIFSWQASLPLRLELMGDEVESLRQFDPHAQTSLRAVEEAKLLFDLPAKADATLHDYLLSEDALVYLQEPDAGATTAGDAAAKVTVDLDDLGFYSLDLPVLRTGGTNPGVADAFTREVRHKLSEWNRDGWKLAIFYQHDAEEVRVRSFLGEIGESPFQLEFRQCALTAGFQYPAGKFAVLTSRELFGGSYRPLHSGGVFGGRGAVSAIKRSQIDFSELVEGQLVVHIQYGLARFLGVQAARESNIEGDAGKAGNGQSEDVLALEFAEGARLYVPLSQSYLVSRYVALGKKGTALNKLGDGRWSAARKSAEKSVYDYAAKLLKLQAQRETQVGHAFAPDTPWQSDFESTFPYTETADQLRAISEVKADMETSRPMDRLICGDVGFGKTEVAIRAAFKAVMSGKQAAMLVPTTVLAQQHYENFARRMEQFPVTLGLLSRFRSDAEQQRTLRGLKDGSVDLVIGTHRLISDDVVFKDLGLLIVDEEQRFGVRHKERIKNNYPVVDILTLSATPIPRTLYLSLVGTRDLSTLDTPPPNRFAVETVVCPYDERIIRDAITRELSRQGQVYFLHNRVHSIERVQQRLATLCPKARIDLGHGQMEEGQLEEVMHRFVNGETDVLVATTIIESGLDIPNANTIIIDRADRFGLADLYQLRGRVGRGTHKAYAFLMLPRELMMAPESRKRLSAIRQYSALGAGFKIALRDLEIRGAGNILGVAQSGHITAIGFELYCQLLRQAVAHLKGDAVQARLEVTLRLDFVADTEASFSENRAALPAFLPGGFIEDSRLRIGAYRSVAEVLDREGVASLRASWRDRFGPLPAPAENFLRLTELKLAAAEKRVSLVETRGDKLMLTRRGELWLPKGRFPRLTSPKPDSRLREIFSLIDSLPA